MISTLSKKHNFDTVFDSQKVYRLLLEAMSNPMRTINIKSYADKLFGEYPALLALAMTLLDNEVGFTVVKNDHLSEDIATLTLAPQVTLNNADFVFVCVADEIETVISTVKCGTLSHPHQSATVIIHNDGAQEIPVTLSGPGINGSVSVNVSRLIKDTVICRDKQYYEYPQGIDLIFVTSRGELLAIPRLTRLEEN